ncbi:hypothetical protein CVD25_12525 [Bacillus canaveralius]|uniref:Uncharacterized protein n=1 Tax=Bacillus canaveralius TaxID=1403243 RepID=A0A2N5GNR2_9BACI|nr:MULTISPECIES: hypothetical protein [Bacillus]PLR84138.1 hypothetical protein CU635_07480 [Bacillus canaveralius]PLR87542.1 hypothetical protein CVD23_02785 [Bacillus sp. V33-4]PLR96216.1 hypothetical protein CVD25_12525 [Bacillus canaveralius]RSK53164.1 hypothetical protein EJA13_09090 [Bacillus canaveralius]
MDAVTQDLISELRKTRQELQHKLNGGQSSVYYYIQAELHDVDSALKKLQAGDYGKCEVSGELLPAGLLAMIPTLKSIDDISKLDQYYRKSLH